MITVVSNCHVNKNNLTLITKTKTKKFNLKPLTFLKSIVL